MNNLTAMMADFAAYQAEHESRVSQQISILKAALIPHLQQAQIARVEVRFDGCGESGAVEELLCFDAGMLSWNAPTLPLSRSRTTSGTMLRATPHRRLK